MALMIPKRRPKGCNQAVTGGLPRHHDHQQHPIPQVFSYHKIPPFFRSGCLLLFLVFSFLYLWDTGAKKDGDVMSLRNFSVTEAQTKHKFSHKTHLGSSKTHRRPLHPGKTVDPSDIFHPPLIDKVKLAKKLERLEMENIDMGEDREFATESQEFHSILRWPPIISQVPSSPGLFKEDYSTHIADSIFCATTPCRLLLPVWTNPLHPSQVIEQLQLLLDSASRLNRTLVIPNAGPVYNESNGDEDILLGLGTCFRYPAARYFDIASVMPTTSEQYKHLGRKPVVPFPSFVEWVKYRPSNPTAQIISVNSRALNDTFFPNYDFGNSEIVIDDQVERGQGKHKNCLSSKASRLKFGGSPPLILSPKPQHLVFQILSDSIAEVEEDEELDSTIAYLEDIHRILSSKDTILKGFDDAGDSTTLNLINHDVLVIEWEIEPVTKSKADSESIIAPLDYSPRLYALASAIVSTLPRPLVMLRSDLPEITSETATQTCTCPGLGALWETISIIEQNNISKLKSQKISLDTSNESIVMDTNVEGIERSTGDDSKNPGNRVLGTIWFGDSIQSTLMYMYMYISTNKTAEPSFETVITHPANDSQITPNHDQPPYLRSPTDNFTSVFDLGQAFEQVIGNFIQTNLTASLVQIEEKKKSLYMKDQNRVNVNENNYFLNFKTKYPFSKSKSWAGTGVGVGIDDDPVLLAILEELVARNADYVIPFSCSSCA